MKPLLMLAALLILGIGATMAKAEDCPDFEKHNCAKDFRLTPTNERLVCVQVEVGGEKKVTYHFRRPDRSYYRKEDPVARTFAGKRSIWFARSRFEQVLNDGGTIKICAGERGEFGVVFEKEDIIRHLKHGPECKETIRLTGGVYPKKQ